MKYRIFGSVDDNEHPTLFTLWSLMHFIFGAILYFWVSFFFPYVKPIIKALAAFILHSIYEFKDYYISYVVGKGKNSLFNSFGDTIMCILGISLAFMVEKKWKPLPISLLLVLTAIFGFLQFILASFLEENKFD